jgi:hypothetical protein
MSNRSEAVVRILKLLCLFEVQAAALGGLRFFSCRSRSCRAPEFTTGRS